MPSRYCKKPVVIEAVKYTGDIENYDELHEFMQVEIDPKSFFIDERFPIETLEGPLYASLGDFIIKGLRGEFYPCKPDIFWQTYDEVKDES